MYLGRFFNRFSALGLKAWHTLGIDPATGWQELYDHITYNGQNTQVIAGDCSNWDTSVTPYMVEWTRRLIQRFYDQDSSGCEVIDREARVRAELLAQMVRCLTSLRDDVYVSECMKSGFTFTTPHNSLLQILCGLYSIAKTKALSPPEMISLREERFVVNGDDNLYAITPGEDGTAKAKGLVEGYKECGFTLNSCDKVSELDQQPITEVEYLQRTFNTNSRGGIVPGVADKTIDGLILYTKLPDKGLSNFRDALHFCRLANDYKKFCKVLLYYAIIHPWRAYEVRWRDGSVPHLTPKYDAQESAMFFWAFDGGIKKKYLQKRNIKGGPYIHGLPPFIPDLALDFNLMYYKANIFKMKDTRCVADIAFHHGLIVDPEVPWTILLILAVWYIAKGSNDFPLRLRDVVFGIQEALDPEHRHHFLTYDVHRALTEICGKQPFRDAVYVRGWPLAHDFSFMRNSVFNEVYWCSIN